MIIDEDVMHIAFCTDENYVKYTGVAITSIILNNIGENICFHIIYSEINNVDKERLLLLGELYAGVEIKLYCFDEVKRFDSYKTTDHYTKAMFYRLYIPDIIDKSIKKILYLDGDILCIGNIKELFYIDMTNYAVMARYLVRDNHMERLKISTNKYLCSGQLLINIDQWKCEKITERVLEILDNLHLDFLFPDQDALNCYFDGNFMIMPEEYGRFIDCAITPPDNIEPNDKIIHFLRGVKPWQVTCFTDRKEIWWEYAKKSFWSDLKLEEPKDLETAIMVAEKFAELGKYKEAVHYYDIVVKRMSEKLGITHTAKLAKANSIANMS